jgi:putative nucleotidyltransferase with HDIG domain
MAVAHPWPDEETLLLLDEQPQAVRALLLMMAAKHRPTYLHLCQVSTYARMLAHRLKLSPSEVDKAGLVGLLHDIGKVAIPDAILTKPGKLDDAEVQVVAEHPRWGAEIIARTGGLEAVSEAVLYHHEWWDGRGYPTGRRGKAIPLHARIVAIADAFDTMTAPRPYRRSVTVEAALAELERCSGTQFDPELVPVFAAMMRDAGVTDLSGIHFRPGKPVRLLEQVEPLAYRIHPSKHS